MPPGVKNMLEGMKPSRWKKPAPPPEEEPPVAAPGEEPPARPSKPKFEAFFTRAKRGFPWKRVPASDFVPLKEESQGVSC
jgi:hypothetical protein